MDITRFKAIEDHPDYQRYRELTIEERATLSEQKRKVKFDRFLRTADNVIMAENLKRMNDRMKIDQYLSLIAAESGTLKRETSPDSRTDQ